MAEAQERASRPRTDKVLLRTRGWQVADINASMVTETGAFVALTQQDDSAVILNCYQPGQHDDMHCHPKEEHVFLVWKGRLHLTGVEDGEDVVLAEGQFAHIDANYYYRLHNPGPGPAVYCQFRTVPQKQPKRRIVLFEESARGKRTSAATAAPANADG
ncbi:MAG: cupin domain-containing protein [Chloroflexi bacterium]|nr:cupin domain-containing protein [Chloroflexota bacterium]